MLALIVTTLRVFGQNFFKISGSSGDVVARVPAADVLEVRDSTNATYAVVRGADPIADNDFATKGWVEGGAPAFEGVVRTAGRAVALVTGSTSTVVPNGQQLRRLAVNITTPYSAGTTAAFSCGGVTVAAAGVIDPTVGGVTVLEVLAPTTANGPLTCTIAGGPVVGAMIMAIDYANPNP